MNWKKGRGKLGTFQPLLGDWITNKGSKDSTNPECTRKFEKTLGGKYIQLNVTWFLGKEQYEDITLIGTDSDKEVHFWSFTSDGKNSTGTLADVTDIHPKAIGFEAQMPSGFARQAYWPDDQEGFHWVVESKIKKGWNRFVEQHFKAMDNGNE